MTEAEIARVRAALIAMHDQLMVEGDLAVAVEIDEPVASAADQDIAPYREMDQAIASARNRERAVRMSQVMTAQRHLADDPDTFGLCEECDEPIAPRRLELMPFATLCVRCQSATEGPIHSTRRKVTDYVG